MSGWIPVEFAVPKKPYRVLVAIKYAENQPAVIEIAEYYGDGIWQVDNIRVDVVAWQMLPEYEEEKDAKDIK